MPQNKVNSENKIIGIGYNGFPIGIKDEELPWSKDHKEQNETKYPYVVHAELNAILNSTQIIKNGKLYSTLFPCNECTKAIIQSGLKEIIFLSDKYKDTDSIKASKKMLSLAGISFRQYENGKHSDLILNFK